MNSVFVAAAGAGKTSFIVRQALADSRQVGIFTYTNDNEEQVRLAIYKIRGYIPDNIKILSWFAFLLKHGVRPFQSLIWEPRIKGMNLVSSKSGYRYKGRNGPVYWGEDNIKYFYFDSKYRIYSDKVAKFAVRCNELYNGAVIKRMKKLFSVVYIDEIQDLAGYDLELLRLLMLEGVEVCAVGDPRQCTYLTHIDQKYKKYAGPFVAEFFRNECKKLGVIIDETTLGISFRNNSSIVEISSCLYPNLPTPKPVRHVKDDLDGVQFIAQSDLLKFINHTGAVQLRYSISDKKIITNLPLLNMGRSKGLEYDSVVISPTDEMLKWLLGKPIDLKDKTRALLYVSLTRAKNISAIIIPDKDFSKIWIGQVTCGIKHCRVNMHGATME